MSKKVALITDITGQDGAYLAEYLLSKGYEVHGIKEELFVQHKIDHLIKEKNFHFHHGDMTDSSSIVNIISKRNLVKYIT